MKKRLLSLFCTFALLAGLLSGRALAADASWAADAVSKLNGIYGSGGSGPFSADDSTQMTEGDAASIASSVGWTTNKVASDSTTQLSRGTACEVLADVFDLPVDTASGETAIKYLYAQNIINGVSKDNLNETGYVTKAEFAVLTYRVLNSVGGGMGSSIGLKPGMDEYFAWMYLAARACVPFQSSQIDKKISEVHFWVNGNQVQETAQDSFTEKSDANLWTYWKTQLGITSEVPAYSGEQTLLEAAKTLVKSTNAATIFSDVEPGNYQNGGAYYDGVMYLFDHGLISGNGDGTFNPNGALCRYELAALLARVDKYQLSDEDKTDPIKAYKEHAVEKGYLTPPQGVEITNNTWWGAPITPDYTANPETAIVTREEAIVAVMKACVAQATIDKANTAALDRFSDADNVSEAAKPYVAYAISIGLVSGTGNAQINPSGQVNRGTIGVLLYRTLIGLDTSKMHDYGQNVQNALGTGITSTEP